MIRFLVFVLFVFFSSIKSDHGPGQEAGPSRDPIVIQVIHLDYADAEHLDAVLAPLLSKKGRVVIGHRL